LRGEKGRLTGKTAIVTGAAGGIGRATVSRFCREGAWVLATDQDEAGLDTVCIAVRTECPAAEIHPAVADIGEDGAAEAIAAIAQAQFGGLDILVNLAGMRLYLPLGEADAASWDRILRVNLLSFAHLTRAALPMLRAGGQGSVVNVSSTHAVNPRAGMGQYDATKAAIVSMTRTLAFEEARHGIRANAVCPGLTLTPFHRKRAEAAGRTQLSLDREGQTGCLLGRWADPAEIAAPIAWLASDEASYVTASVLMVDGGRYVSDPWA
jgi:NAD(P)-dependent dehydrogenase (short-subunit alcohol dehydrogenase family)